jgi:hypothetical protein
LVVSFALNIQMISFSIYLSNDDLVFMTKHPVL